MKNFKLLLATTAILSTALAINTKAANPTQDMNVDVEIVRADAFQVWQHMNFGRWVVPSGTKSITLSMDQNGNVTTTTAGATRIETGRKGKTLQVPCNTLSFPATVYLRPDTEHTKDLNSGSYRLTNITATAEGTSDFECAIHGDLTIASGSSSDIESTQYSASFTITAMLGLDD